MSISDLVTLAERGRTPGPPAGSPARLSADDIDGTQGDGGPDGVGDGDADDKAPGLALQSFFPVEVAAAYTAVLGVLSGVLVDSPNDEYVPLRWSLVAVGVLAVIVAVLTAYLVRKRADPAGKARRGQVVLSIAVGTVSFAAWALITPGSALYFWLDSPTLPVTVGAITAGSLFLVGAVFRPILDRPEPGGTA